MNERGGECLLMHPAHTLHPSLVRSNCSTLYANMVLQYCFRSIDRDLIVGGITILDAQIVILNFDVQERQNKLQG